MTDLHMLAAAITLLALGIALAALGYDLYRNREIIWAALLGEHEPDPRPSVRICASSNCDNEAVRHGLCADCLAWNQQW